MSSRNPNATTGPTSAAPTTPARTPRRSGNRAQIGTNRLRNAQAWSAYVAKAEEEAYRERVVRGLKRKAAELGLELVDTQAIAATN